MLNNFNTELDNIKEKLKQNILYVDTFEDTDVLLFNFITNKYIIFNSIIQKNYFINNVNRNVINCNSSYEKFVDEMEMYFSETTIFNNIKFCNNKDILEIIEKTNNLKIE